MATLDFTFTFDSDAQALADSGFSAGLTFAFEGGDGNPSGCVKWTGTLPFFPLDAEFAIQPAGTQTWEDIGIPVGSTITNVETVTVDRETVDETGVNPSDDAAMEMLIKNDAGTTLFNSTLFRTVSGALNTWTTTGGIGSPAMAWSGTVPSSDYFRLQLHISVGGLFSSAGGTYDYRFDNLIFRITYTPPPEVLPPSVDVCATIPGIHIAYRQETNILVYSTFDAGENWSLALVTTDACDCSNPTIAADHLDNLYVAWHTDAPDVEIAISTDWGATWALWATVAGASWPRASFGPDAAHLAFWAAGSIDIYRSTDFLATLSLVASFAVSEEQLCDLAVSGYTSGGDRRYVRRVVYTDSGSVKMRRSDDGVTWGTATTLTSGDLPVMSLYVWGGIVIWWVDDVPYIQAVGSDYVTGVGSPVVVTTAAPRQYIGLTVDRFDLPWLIWVYFPPDFIPPDNPSPSLIIFGPQPGMDPPISQFLIGDGVNDPGLFGFMFNATSDQLEMRETPP